MLGKIGCGLGLQILAVHFLRVHSQIGPNHVLFDFGAGGLVGVVSDLKIGLEGDWPFVVVDFWLDVFFGVVGFVYLVWEVFLFRVWILCLYRDPLVLFFQEIAERILSDLIRLWIFISIHTLFSL